jgi:hypothetical protein
MYSVQQKLDYILWLAEFKLYTCVWCKFNHVYPNQGAPIYRYGMSILKRQVSVLQQNELPCHMVS